MTPTKRKERKQAGGALGRSLEHALAYGSDNKEGLEYAKQAEKLIQKAQLPTEDTAAQAALRARRNLRRRLRRHMASSKPKLPDDALIMAILRALVAGPLSDADLSAAVVLPGEPGQAVVSPISVAIGALVDTKLIRRVGDRLKLTEDARVFLN